MLRTVLNAKIHRATVTDANLDYVGSLTVSRDLMDGVDLVPGEQVAVVDVTNGARLETYVIEGPADSGVICANGAAAHLIHPGDIVIILSYAQLTADELREHRPRIAHVDSTNRIVSVTDDPLLPLVATPAAPERPPDAPYGHRTTGGAL